MEANSASQDPECFHDGLKVLGVVDTTLKDLIDYRRVSDPVTEGLVPLILKMLWRETPRPCARDLWIEAQRILEVSGQRSMDSPNSPRFPESMSIVHSSDPETSDGISSREHPEWRENSYHVNSKNTLLTKQSLQTHNRSLGDRQRSPSLLSKFPTTSPIEAHIQNGSPRAFEKDAEVFQQSSEFILPGRRPTTESTRSGGLDSIVMAPPRRESLFSMIQQSPPDMHALERSIDLGSDVDERNMNGQTPIMVAADMGDFRVVKLLLHKARLDVQDKLGQTLLHQIPRKNGGENMLEMILSHAQVNGRHIEVNAAGIGGRTPLHEAVRTGKSKAIRLLIEQGANVNIRDNRRTLPSTVAIEGEKVMALECLLKYDCEIDPDKADPRIISKDIKWMLKRYQKLPKKK